MAKYKRPIIDILNEVITGMVRTVIVEDVVANVDGTQTITACDIFYIQAGFNVTINNLSYVVTAFSQENETVTLKANFEGVNTINVNDTFDLYAVKFYHGTPISTQQEIEKVVDAADKTPMLWLWETFKERNFDSEMVEREIDVELYALTQSYDEKLAAMVNDDIHHHCVEPMRRLIEQFLIELVTRSDIFDTDFQEYETENFPKFGIVARSKGAEKSLYLTNLSGVALYTTLRLYFKDACECPPFEPTPIPPPSLARTVSEGGDRTLSTLETRTVSA